MDIERKKKYRHLFFDLDNTLWDFETNAYNALREAFVFFGLGMDDLEYQQFYYIFSLYNAQLWNEYRNGKIIKKKLVKQRFEFSFNHMNIKGIDPIEMNALFLCEMPKQKKLVEGAEGILEYLKQKVFNLYVITNGFSDVQHGKMLTSGIRHYFKKVFTSEDIQSPKPAREIFTHALTSVNARKTDSLMIGDDYVSDFLGALKFGMDAVYFSNPRKHQVETVSRISFPGRQHYEINTLKDLAVILSQKAVFSLNFKI